MLRELSVSGYRSIVRLRFRLRRVNVLTGPNGCGKSNLYNSLFLLSKAVAGGFARTIAEEGGMESVLWAGRRKRGPVRMTIGISNERFSYELTCGLPMPAGSAFDTDPEVKEEYVSLVGSRRAETIMFERNKSGVWARDRDGRRVSYSGELVSNESVLSQLRDPHLYPELSMLRMELASWRFYHQFRSDMHSPLRQPQVGVRTPVLSHDGQDLAAALQTITEIGDRPAMQQSIANALGGATVAIQKVDGGRLSLSLNIPGMLRPLRAEEFSDGTLRFLCLAAALLSPRPPTLLALNEPETSLHPDLLEPLAQLIARAARSSQLWITTHSRPLADAIEAHTNEPRVELQIVNGATSVVGQGLILRDAEP